MDHQRNGAGRGISPAGVLLIAAFGLYAMVAAALFAFNMPPYQNADETNHFLRADSVSRGHLLGQRVADGTDFGGIASPEIARSGVAFDWPKFHPERKVTASEYDAAFAKLGTTGAPVGFPNTAVYPPTLYLPSVAAIWIGRASRMSVLQTLYLARLATAALSAAAIGGALFLCLTRGANGAALGIFAAATLPMALSVQSAVSQDGPMLGVAALVAALLVRLRQAPSALALVGLCASVTVLAMARPPYVCLALLPLAARGRLGPRLWAVCVSVAACVLWSVAVSRVGHVSVSTNNADLLTQGAVLLDPGRLLALLATTFRIYWWEYSEHMIGRLGWLDVNLPLWYVNATMIGLALCLVSVVRPFDWRGLVATMAVVLSAIAVVLLIYLTWTSVGRPVIEGVQGRYFLPLLAILFGLGVSQTSRAVLVPLRVAVLVWPAVSIGVTMRALVVRYYLGA